MFIEFKDVEAYVTRLCNSLGRIPSKKEIDDDLLLKSSSTVSRMFVKETGKSMADFYSQMGFTLNKRKSFEDKVSFSEILDVLTNECKRLNRIPSYDEIKEMNLPTGDTLRKIFVSNIGKSYVEYFEEHGFQTSDKINRHMYNADDFVVFKDKLILYSSELGRIPTVDEIKNCPDLPSIDHIRKLFEKYLSTSYTEFLHELGYRFKNNERDIYKKVNFIETCKIIIDYCEKLGRIPTEDELKEVSTLPSVEILRRVFKLNNYRSYTDYCRQFGYKRTGQRNRPVYLTYVQLCALWEDYYRENGRYPNAQICSSDKSLPTWKTVKEICSDNFEEFLYKYSTRVNHMVSNYNEYCEMFRKVCSSLGKVLTVHDLINNKYELPSSRWFIKHCPDSNVKNYNDFLIYLDFKPYYNVPKDYAIQFIMKKFEKLQRPIKIKDFSNPSDNEIGIGTITSIWGSFNNMLKELGLPINQESMVDRQKSLDELKNDIIKLCKYIEETERRKVISRDDVRRCNWCLDPQAYDRWFKRELKMNLSKFIKSIGYTPIKSGMGMLHEFNDGEITMSKFEYMVSKFLREKNIQYARNVKYKEFVADYQDNKDCDYVVLKENTVWYIEIAGMIDSTKKKQDDRILSEYKKNLEFKIHMLERNNLNYKIIYPNDFYHKPIDEFFSFLLD